MARLMTPEEVATLLQVSEETLRYWRKHGSGPPYAKLGQLIRYQEDDVRRWIAERTVK